LINKVLSRLQQQLVAVAYDESFSIQSIKGVPVKGKFRIAGHILGSAYVELDIASEECSQRIVFSGDLGAPYTPLLPAPKSPYKADVLVIESTYGDRLHEGRKKRRKQLKGVIERCYDNGGTVLIPAFSIGRTQELLYEIEEIIHRQQNRRADKNGGVDFDWSAVDVVIDSPLAASFTKAYGEMRELWDAEARRKVLQGRHPLDFDQLITVDKHEDHLRLVDYLRTSGRPAIVIAASGMCAGGVLSII
jgi:Predicted exonuclease of the beta-lactamase fold involved in RNA processing